MRKLISASKRKWVLGGILGFAAVALTTTGFATWIVGVQRTKQDNELNVSVGTATNNSIVLTATLSDSIVKLQETTAVPDSGKLVTTGFAAEGEGAVDPNALKFKFETLKIEFGEDYNFTFTKLKFKFVKLVEGVYQDTTYGTSTESLTGDFARTTHENPGPWTYIECPADVDITGAARVVADNGIKTYEIETKEYALSWGSFFGGSSPATFYNSKVTGSEDLNTLAKLSGEITTELKAMKTYFETGLSGKIMIEAYLA